MSGQMTLRRHVVRIVPDERDFVSKVHAESNQLVKKGEPLFEMSRARFQYAVNQAKANLAASASTVSQLEASVAAAEASARKSDADTGIAKAQIDTAKKLRRSSAGAVAKLRIAEAEAAYHAAQAGTEVARASLVEAKSSLAAARHGVDAARAALGTARHGTARHGTVHSIADDILILGGRAGHQLSDPRTDPRGQMAIHRCGHAHGFV
jgi:multidrug resistance efflux pump